ncbi:hypothetical protein [Pseudonocardia humida]|uniref:Uncharacterized protein n=1 Tax=Pseudonocardia humida TaxID=2800819 RepID=A0ABT1A187_9PSEU|nr:hypothetical protein [Pseudonocardia humida]MCO1656760.1 hypothetical protein [Pseudonocardia humida]
MSNPGQGGNQPYQGDNPYAGPGAYRGPSDPGRYGSSPAYGQQEPYAYSPYANQGPAGTGGADQPAPVRRPGLLVLSLVLLVLSALPFLIGGLVFLVVAIDVQEIVALLPTIDPNGQLAAAGITPEQILDIVRTAGGIVAAMAAIYVLFAVLAFTGRNWARIVVAVLTTGFGLLLLAGLVQGASAGSGSGLSMAVLAASVAGTVLMFVPASQQYFASRRR